MYKQTLIKIGIGVLVIAVIICVIVFSNNEDGTEKPTEGDGVIIGVGDNNNDNNGDKVTADNDNEDNTSNNEETTTEPPREVIESTDSVAGNWVAFGGSGTVMEFIPDRNNEAVIYIPEKNIYYAGTYETDDKTYIKIDYYNVYDDSITGVMELSIIEMRVDTFGEINLTVKDMDGTEYIMRPAN